METLSMSIMRDKEIVETNLNFPTTKFDSFWVDEKEIHYYVGGREFVCKWTKELETKCCKLCD